MAKRLRRKTGNPETCEQISEALAYLAGHAKSSLTSSIILMAHLLCKELIVYGLERATSSGGPPHELLRPDAGDPVSALQFLEREAGRHGFEVIEAVLIYSGYLAMVADDIEMIRTRDRDELGSLAPDVSVARSFRRH